MTGLANNTTDNKTKWRLNVDDRVRLRNEVADIYTLAYGGAEGWITDRKIDSMGDFKMVHVRWDRDHWSYNDQPDMWTFEEHFDKVEDEKPMAEESDKNELATALQILAKGLGVDLGGSESVAAEEKTEGESRAEAVTPDEMKQFEHILERALEVASDSDAFIIACVKKDDPPEGSDAAFVLAPAVFSYALSRESSVLLDSVLADVVVQAHQSLAFQEIHRLSHEGDSEK